MSINRKQPDRPPLDLGGPAWSIADTPPYGYRKFCEYLGFMDVSIAIRPGTRIVSSIDER
ncbi:MAG: hypothetical protein GTN80_11330, partial [Nitrososphaeria archaeon]|nr:hypothetical protein [Nitrososphaeria archaeon]